MLKLFGGIFVLPSLFISIILVSEVFCMSVLSSGPFHVIDFVSSWLSVARQANSNGSFSFTISSLSNCVNTLLDITRLFVQERKKLNQKQFKTPYIIVKLCNRLLHLQLLLDCKLYLTVFSFTFDQQYLCNILYIKSWCMS